MPVQVRDPARSVRKAALGALSALAGSWCLEETDVDRLSGAVQTIVEVARVAWTAGDEETLADVLCALAAAAESSKEGFFGDGSNSVATVAELALHTAGTAALGIDVRTQAFHALSTLATAHPDLLVSPHPSLSCTTPLCAVLIPALCNLTTLTDPPSNCTSDGQDAVTLALETLSTFACSLPESHVVPPVLAHVSSAMSSGNAALVAGALRNLAAITEWAAERLVTQLAELLPLVSQGLGSGEGCVRQAAAALAAEVAEHLQPDLAEQHLQPFLLPVLHALQLPPDDEEVRSLSI